MLKTFRVGFAAQAGHDLAIEVTRWSGELAVNDDSTPTAISVQIDMRSLAVREGTGGLKPLTDGDRRDITATMRRLLATDQEAGAEFMATRFQFAGEGGSVDGTLTLRGRSRPLRLQATPAGPGRYRVTGTVLQSGYGIKPYTAFFGALKVRDAVDVEAEAQVPAQVDAPG